MSTVPPEILYQIFIQLNFSERFECMAVCESWLRVLSRYSLFYSIELNEEQHNFNRIIMLFKYLPVYAAQVQHVVLQVSPDGYFARAKLLELFPNARIIRVEAAPIIFDITYRRFISMYTVPHLKTTVEHLTDYRYGEVVSQMIRSNLGGRLQTLCLNFEFEDAYVLRELKNLPVLKRLKLQSVDIVVDALEDIHKRVPSIQELVLSNVCVRIAYTSAIITPATCMTKYEFSGSFEHFMTHAQYYQYIIKKYTNLTEIVHDEEGVSEYTETAKTHVLLNGGRDFNNFLKSIKNNNKNK